MKKLIVLALAFAFVACAEDNRVQKILPVKNGDSMQVFQTVRDVLQGMPITVKLYQNSIVVNGTPETVAAAEQLVKNLESSTPRDRDVEITGYIVLASVQAGDGTARFRQTWSLYSSSFGASSITNLSAYSIQLFCGQRRAAAPRTRTDRFLCPMVQLPEPAFSLSSTKPLSRRTPYSSRGSVCRRAFRTTLPNTGT